MNIYAVYKGDNFLYEGTAIECAKHFGVQRNTVYYWTTELNKKRRLGKTKKGKERNGKIAIIIDQIEDI